MTPICQIMTAPPTSDIEIIFPALNVTSVFRYKMALIVVQRLVVIAFSSVLSAVINADGCGYATVNDNRIVNGVTSKRGSHPWLVSLEYDLGGSLSWDHKCAGAIINKRWILTAAHCFEELSEMNKWRVIGGEYEKHTLDGSEQIIALKMIVKHPDFNGQGHTNDIALIQLAENIRTNTGFSRPICLPKEGTKFVDHSYCVVAGWGSTYFTVALEDTHKLQEYNSTILPLAECNAAAELHDVGAAVTEDMICIKTEYDRQAKKGTGGVCAGDSGGPLLCKLEDNHFYIAGVVAWSLRRPCGFTHDIFTRVQSYREWMNNVMENVP